MSLDSLIRFDLDPEKSPDGHFDVSVRTVPKSFPWIALVAFTLFGVVASAATSEDIGIIIAGFVMGCFAFVGFSIAARREHRFRYDGTKLHVESGSSARSFDAAECEAFFAKRERKIRTQSSVSGGSQSVSSLFVRVAGKDIKLSTLGTMTTWTAEFLHRHVCKAE